MRNVLITTLAPGEKLNKLKYYNHQDENGQCEFCTGISVAEAGTKYMLSRFKIDEILVVASSAAINETDETKLVPLKDIVLKNSANLANLSDYGFYLYRIQQFIDGIDIDLYDAVDSVSEEFLIRHKKILKDISEQNSIDINGAHFRDLTQYKEPYYSYYKKIKCEVPEDSFNYQVAVAYSKMDSRYKMFPLDVNKNINVTFVPVDDMDSERFEKNYDLVIADLMSMNKDDVKLYVDLQGFGFGNAYSFFNMLSIYSESAENRVELAGVIQTLYDEDLPTNPIINEWKRYEIQKLLIGVKSFLNHGKSEDICKYWESRETQLPAVNDLIEGTKYVDEGISFCNIPVMRYGVGIIRAALRAGEEIRDPAFLLMKGLIEKDYGDLLKDEKASIPALLQWTVKKKMFQQALSIIESHLPEDMVDRGIFYYAKEASELENIKKELNVCFWNDIAKCRYIYKDIDHFMVKTYGRYFINNAQRKDLVQRDLAELCVRRTHNMAEGALPAYSNLNNDKLLYELIYSYMDIGTLRNLVCHAIPPELAGENCETLKPESNMEKIVVALNRFVKLYCSACEQVDDKDYVPVRLTEEDFRSYTSRHKLQPFETAGGECLDQNIMCSFNGKDVAINIKLLAPEE